MSQKENVFDFSSPQNPPRTRAKPPRTRAKPPCTRAKPPRTRAKPPRTRAKPPRTRAKPPRTRAKCLRTRANTPRTRTKPQVDVQNSPRSGLWHKAWGKAQRNPRTVTPKKLVEPAKRPIAVRLKNLSPDGRLSAAPRALGYFQRRVPGVPLRLHPRLYAVTRSAGFSA
jgi:hypothetical protein